MSDTQNNSNPKIGIIGLGYVGLPIAVEYAKAGISVIGFDIDKTKVDTLLEGNNYIDDVNDEDLRNVVKDNKFTATTDFSLLKETDGIFICVPTPFSINKDPDVSFIINAEMSFVFDPK